jgi:hypothetical protein
MIRKTEEYIVGDEIDDLQLEITEFVKTKCQSDLIWLE